jgi:hypothetical protein
MPIRLAVLVVCAERLVGTSSPAGRASQVSTVTGLSLPDAERACSAGAELIQSCGPTILRVPNSTLSELAGCLNSVQSGGASQWIESVSRRAGDASGTALGEFIASVRLVCGTPASPSIAAIEPAARVEPAVASEVIVTEVATSSGGRLEGIDILVGEDESAEEVLDALEGGTDSALFAELEELTFDDELLGDAGPAANAAGELGAELVEVDAGDALDASEDDDLLLSDETIDDLLSDDSVDLDDDWCDDQPPGT